MCNNVWVSMGSRKSFLEKFAVSLLRFHHFHLRSHLQFSIFSCITTIHNLIHFYLVIHKPSFVSCSDLESQLSIALHCTPHFLCRFIYMGPKLHHGKMTLGKNCFLSVVRFKFHLHIYGSFWTCGFLK